MSFIALIFVKLHKVCLDTKRVASANRLEAVCFYIMELKFILQLRLQKVQLDTNLKLAEIVLKLSTSVFAQL